MIILISILFIKSHRAEAFFLNFFILSKNNLFFHE